MTLFDASLGVAIITAVVWLMMEATS